MQNRLLLILPLLGLLPALPSSAGQAEFAEGVLTSAGFPQGSIRFAPDFTYLGSVKDLEKGGNAEEDWEALAAASGNVLSRV